MVLFLNRLALFLVVAGVMVFVMKDGANEAVSGNPEGAWEQSVETVDEIVSADDVNVEGSLTDSMTYAEGIGEEVRSIAGE
jgi:hypothetical protein